MWFSDSFPFYLLLVYVYVSLNKRHTLNTAESKKVALVIGLGN